MIKALTFASPIEKKRFWKSREAGESRKIFERMETTERRCKHIYGKVMLAKEIDNMTSNFERKLIVSIKTHLQWRV